MTGDWAPALMVLGAVWILGVWYGLYLNLTHMHRMRAWACRVADVLDDLSNNGPAPAGPADEVSIRREQREAS